MDDDALTVIDEPVNRTDEEIFRVVWAETAPLDPIEGEPGFEPPPPAP